MFAGNTETKETVAEGLQLDKGKSFAQRRVGICEPWIREIVDKGLADMGGTSINLSTYLPTIQQMEKISTDVSVRVHLNNIKELSLVTNSKTNFSGGNHTKNQECVYTMKPESWVSNLSTYKS